MVLRYVSATGLARYEHVARVATARLRPKYQERSGLLAS